MRKLLCTLAAFALVGLFAGPVGAAPADKVAVVASTTDFLWCSQSTKLGASSTIECEDLIDNDGASGGTFTTDPLPSRKRSCRRHTRSPRRGT